MAAAGIAPEQSAMVLVRGSLLQKQASVEVKNKNAEGTVKTTRPVGLHFVESANFLITLRH
jgi:hypothetical protein